MYKARFHEWGWSKNASRQDWLMFAKLYQQRRDINTHEVFIQMLNKVRRIQDLRRYLKAHNEREEAFFIEAVAFDAPVADHMYFCDADGKKIVDTSEMGKPEQSPGSTSSEWLSQSKLSSSLFPPWNSGAEKGSTVGVSQDTMTTASAHNHFFAATTPMITLDQIEDSEFPTFFSEMSNLSTFHAILHGNMDELYQNAYGNAPLDTLVQEPTAISMNSPSTPPQPPEQAVSLEDHDTSWLMACMEACMYSAARKRHKMKLSLQQASTSFQQMCSLQSPFILTAASIMLTWLLVHAEGSISEKIMGTAFQVAKTQLGSDSPVCILLEWIAIATTASKLQECHINSTKLQQVWSEFSRTLGAEHGHTIVALYCLSFHLMNVEKDFIQAEAWLQCLSLVSEKVFGSSNVQTINILATLSRAQHRQKKHTTALETINRSLSVSPWGLNHPHRLELLLRKALILRKLECLEEMEELYWIVVKGRVATLGIHHRTTIAAHNSLVDILHSNGKWEAKKDDAHALLVDPQISVTEYESWWRRSLEANRLDESHEGTLSDEDES